MSTNQNCSIMETTDGISYLVLEQYDAPRNAWDWTDYADVYGPFNSTESAQVYLLANFANPGGLSIDEVDPQHDEHFASLIARAKSPQNPRRLW